MAFGHRTAFTATPGRDAAVPLPAGLDPLLGIYAAQMGPVCANALLHAAREPTCSPDVSLADGVRGRTVLVTGAGVVGLLTALFAGLHGATVVVADATPSRLAVARALGFEVVQVAGDDAWRTVKERWAPGVDLAFQCRATADSLGLALRCLRPQGTVVDLAFYEDAVAGSGSARSSTTTPSPSVVRRSGEYPSGSLTHGTGAGSPTRPSLCSKPRATVSVASWSPDVVPFDEAPQLLADLAGRRRHAVQAVLRVTPDE